MIWCSEEQTLVTFNKVVLDAFAFIAVTLRPDEMHHLLDAGLHKSAHVKEHIPWQWQVYRHLP